MDRSNDNVTGADHAGKVVGVYGSAATAPGTTDYAEAVEVGRALAKAGYAVMTGGYGGAMGAASQGAAEAGGHVIGVTVGLFKERGLVPNPFLKEEVHLPSLAERLNYLIVKPDAYVALRGGVGTLSEIALAWSLIQVGEIPSRPLVAVGRVWREILSPLATLGVMNPRELERITFVESGAAVLQALEAWWANPPAIPLRLGDVKEPPLLGNE